MSLGTANVTIPKTKTTAESTKSVNLYEQYYVNNVGGTLSCYRLSNNNLTKSNPPKYEDYEDMNVDLSVCQAKCPDRVVVKKSGADLVALSLNGNSKSGGSFGSSNSDADGLRVDSQGNLLENTRQTSTKDIPVGSVTIPAGTPFSIKTVAGEDGISSKVFAVGKTIPSSNGDSIPAGAYLNSDGTVQHTAVEYTTPEGLVLHTPAEAQRWAEGKSDEEAGKLKIAKYDQSNTQIGTTKTAKQIGDDAVAETKKETAAAGKSKFDDCQTAYDYAVKHNLPNAEKFKCSTTNGIAKGTEIANQVLTGTGRSLVNQMGANAAQQARNGTLIGDQKAAAQMAKTSSTYETALTVANTAAAYILGKKANEHKQNYAALSDAAKAEKKIKAQTGYASADVDDLKAAQDQQSNARNVASVAAFKATMTAVQSAAGMMAAKSAQKAAEANARLAQDAQDKINAASFKYDPNQLAPPVTNAFDPKQMAATGGADATGTGTGTTASSDGSTTGLDNTKLADGTDSGAGSDGINAPNAAAFKSGGAGGAGGGAAGGGAPSAGGGGGGSGGPTAAEDPKAAYASEFGTKERYESGGGIGGAGGAKGGAGGKGADGAGVDLNGLLAQFLPKAEDDSAHRSILDSVAFGGNRNIANEEAPSYLDKNADLFQRIHETMSEKNRRGQLGI